MFVTKGKINTSRFFSMMHHEESPEKPEYNMATPLFLSNHPPLPPFSSKNWGGREFEFELWLLGHYCST